MYEKKKRMLEAVLFPLLLTLYPLIGIRQGLDVSDTLYSLSNFQYFTTMDGTWMVATFLANVLGSLLMCLPFGGTLIGMYFYTSLLQSVTAVLVYRSLKKRMPAVLVFAGEMADGKGVRRAYDSLVAAGLTDIRLKLYPGGRHELLNETNRSQVMQDICRWVEENVLG